MAFTLTNFGADTSNAKGTLGGICYYRYRNENGDTLTNAGYFPADLGLGVGDRIVVIPSDATKGDELYIVTSISNRTVTVKLIDTDGAVDSVNGKVGNVVLDASDVGALPDSTVIPEAIQYETLPTASADELGNIYQFVGTTDATYTNGYFYKCVSDGGNPATYSWAQTNVQPAPSGLPDQTGQSGKFLTTDGTDASWSDKPLVNTLSNKGYSLGIVTQRTVGDYSVSIAASVGLDNSNVGTCSVAIGSDAGGFNSNRKYIVAIGNSCRVGEDSIGIGSINSDPLTGAGSQCVTIGRYAYNKTASTYSVAIGFAAGSSSTYSIAIGAYSRVDTSSAHAIQLGSTGAATTNSDANTFKVANQNGNFEIMSADGTIPAARHAALPAADGTYVLKLVIASGVATLSWVAE